MNDEKQFDPVHLYVRTDEKYEEIRAEMHDVQIEQKDMKNTIDRVEKRVDFGVAITGQKNSEELGRQAVDIGKLKQTQELEQLKLTNLEKTLLGEIKEIKSILAPIYKGILAIFFTLVTGGAVLYAFRFFHFN